VRDFHRWGFAAGDGVGISEINNTGNGAEGKKQADGLDCPAADFPLLASRWEMG
jgi:hypothetical protein